MEDESKSVQCATILLEDTNKFEDDVKHSEASDCVKQRRAKCRWKLDQVAILDYRRYRRLISHQTSRKICNRGDLEETRGRHAKPCHSPPSSIFISFLNIVARSPIFIVVNVVSAGGIPLSIFNRASRIFQAAANFSQPFSRD